MLSYEEALQQILKSVSPLQPIELPLDEAAGLVLARPAVACWDMPRCDNSAMDGFAVSWDPETPPEGFEVIGSSYAGHPYHGAAGHGQAIRITTGAAVPEGTDTVIPIEDAVEQDHCIQLSRLPRTGQHVRYQGEEYRAGETLIETGTLLRAGEIALLASAGVDRVWLHPRPRVAVFSTGDELIPLGRPPGPGQIINSNMHLLNTRLSECGVTPICLGIGPDDPDNLETLIAKAGDADLVISTGGVSVGEKDHVLEALTRHDFRKIFWKVAIKPGKPVLFGLLDNKPFFGLPGNPAASAATFELFVKPALSILAGHRHPHIVKRTGLLNVEIKGGGKRRTFLWCTLEWQESGYVVSVRQHQGSGQNRSIQGANALLAVPDGTECLPAGTPVEVIVL